MIKENANFKMKLVVKYNLLKYADNEEKSQTNKKCEYSFYYIHLIN